LYPTWEGTKMIQGKCWCPSRGSTKFQGRKPNVVSTTTHQKDVAFEEIELPKTWSIHYHITNQWCGLLIQTSKLHEDPFSVSCFLVGTLSCIHHPRMGFMVKNMDQVYATKNGFAWRILILIKCTRPSLMTSLSNSTTKMCLPEFFIGFHIVTCNVHMHCQ
jgi:hypothetical protein